MGDESDALNDQETFTDEELGMPDTVTKPAFVFREFDDRIEKYLADVRAQADKLGLRDKLERQLDRLVNYANREGEREHRCVLYYDSAPLSFGFNIETKQADGTWKFWFNGGLIFHGRHDGYGSGQAPTFSVSLTPVDDDWSIHT